MARPAMSSAYHYIITLDVYLVATDVLIFTHPNPGLASDILVPPC